MAYAGRRPVACLAWSSAPRHLGERDRFIGWSPEARLRNIGLLAYNTRFLILPWVVVPHLASHLLGRVAREIAADWQRAYGHPVHYLKTFVDPQLFRGTCYRAANWILLGLTTGRGKDATSSKANRPLKQILGYPLAKDFRQRRAHLGAECSRPSSYPPRRPSSTRFRGWPRPPRFRSNNTKMTLKRFRHMLFGKQSESRAAVCKELARRAGDGP